MITWKKYFIIFVFFFVVQSIAISLFFDSKNQEISHAIKSQQEHFISTYNTIFDTYSNLPKIIFQGQIKNNYIASILKNAYETKDKEYKNLLREELKDELKNTYNSTLKTTGFKQLQFILQNGESFLRFSMLNQYGNMLKHLRFSVKKMANLKQPLEGFENGIHYNGYRYIYPLFLNDDFVGSVDITLDIETYLNFATKALGGEQRFIMKWEGIQKSSLKTEGKTYIRSCLSPNFIYERKQNYNIFNILASINRTEKEKIAKKLMLDEPFSVQINMNKGEYLAIFLPIFTIEKKVGGFIIGVKKANFIADINKSFYKNIAFSLASSLLIILLFIGYSKEKYLLQELVLAKNTLEIEVQERTKELQHSAGLLNTILATIPTPVFYKDLEGRFILCNKAFFKLFDKEPCNIIGKKSQEIFSAQMARNIITNDKKALHERRTVISEMKLDRGEDGQRNLMVYRNVLLEEEKPVGIIGVIHDITKQKKSQNKIATAFNKIKKQQKILESDYEIIQKYTIYTKMDKEFIITDVSNALCAIFGLSKNKIIGKRHFELLGNNGKGPMYEDIRASLLEGKAYEAEFQVQLQDHELWTRTLISPEYDEEDNLIGYVAFSHDITKEKMIEEHSYTDELTQLYNRKKFNEELDAAIKLFDRYQENISLILFDIDKFKKINDTHGHLIGDKILKELAKIVTENIRECDTIARWGGEEFVIILPKTTQENAIVIANKLRQKIKEHHFGIKGSVTCSFGITVLKEGDTTISVIKRVDDLLYQAKNDGRDKIIYE